MPDTTTTTTLPAALVALLRRPSTCLVATTKRDGSPQLTQTWVDTDGEHVVVNTVEGYAKLANVRRDPRVALSILDPDDPSSYWSLAATVVAETTDGGAEGIERLSQKYTGGPYRSYGGPGQIRVVLTIRVDKVVQAPWG